ncbi:MAG: NlpC/P60 family protein [Pseudomonadota bacterium]
MDRRDRPANDRVAHVDLAGVVAAPRRVEGTERALIHPLADLCAAPRGPRDAQLLFGDVFLELERRDQWSFGRSARDGYVGYVRSEALGPVRPASHWVKARQTHVYDAADMKSTDRHALPFGAKLSGVETDTGFLTMADDAHVPLQHLNTISDLPSDPAAVAETLLGTPYLWGGNSVFGIDCSGLVQTAFLACGLRCKRDSDQQRETLGRSLPLDDSAPLRRGDLICWDGHIGMMLDAETLIHASAHHMAVAVEPLAQAEERVMATGFGPIIARKRL